MYNKKVMGYFYNSSNAGVLKDANTIYEVGNAQCADIMQVFLKIEDDIIKDVSFRTFSCGAAIATNSVATELIKGMTVDEAPRLSNKDVVEELSGLPSAKIHCSVLTEKAIKDAIKNYKQGVGTTS